MRLMKVMLFFVFLGLITINTSAAEDLAQLVDKFYGGLADIIERNIDDADVCLAQAKEYYENNQDLVKVIRDESAKAMQQAMPLAEQLMNMPEEELARLGSQQAGAQDAPADSGMSAQAKRYAQAMEAFAERFPTKALQLAGLASQFVLAPEKNPAWTEMQVQEEYASEELKEEGAEIRDEEEFEEKDEFQDYIEDHAGEDIRQEEQFDGRYEEVYEE